MDFGFRKNADGVTARRRRANFEPLGGSLKTLSANNFPEHARLGGGEPEPCAKVLNLGAKIGSGIDNQDSNGRTIKVEDRCRAVGGEWEDMGEKLRVIFAAAELDCAANIAFGQRGPDRLARERMQTVSEGRVRSRQLPTFIA